MRRQSAAEVAATSTGPSRSFVRSSDPGRLEVCGRRPPLSTGARQAEQAAHRAAANSRWCRATAAATATAQVLPLNGSCPPVGGNKVRFLVTGEDSFATLERHIREARHSIDVMTFILARDAVGRRLVRLLAERAGGR